MSLKTNQYSLYGRSVSLFGLIKEKKKGKSCLCFLSGMQLMALSE